MQASGEILRVGSQSANCNSYLSLLPWRAGRKRAGEAGSSCS